MKNLFLVFTILLACNQPGKTVVTDSPITPLSIPDTTAQMAPVSEVLTIEQGDISAAEFEKYRSTYKNIFDNNAGSFAAVNGVTTIPLTNGSASFKNNEGTPHDEDRLAYRYLGAIPALSKYLIEGKGYEYRFYLLLDKNSGAQDTINGIPFITPDKKWFVSYAANPNDEPTPTSEVTIYAVAPGAIAKAWQKTFKQLVKEVCWKDNNTAYLKLIPSEEKASAPGYIRLTIANGNTPATAVSPSWYGNYELVLGKGKEEQWQIQLQVTKEGAVFSETGLQVFNQYALSTSQDNGSLSLTFNKALEGGSTILRKEDHFGHLEAAGDHFAFKCPYLDIRTNNNNNNTYQLIKK
ncbi:hypothetical protein KTO58_15760 [Chitinophaga pendula]|uniref:hypothetical protein n=1 Tax=Chitinophaga TaxID=79328 RepID=UPI000BAFB6CB|nr:MULTISPECIES: hypothetical protein [Chitinophaga]ASZ11829.1 hypothetical protein CK934_13095 [Chitinophaga sp. MD30]UCJ05150.1 hypothetical protein KTO58_15760 [Chitinophaga pendula]